MSDICFFFFIHYTHAHLLLIPFYINKIRSTMSEVTKNHYVMKKKEKKKEYYVKFAKERVDNGSRVSYIDSAKIPFPR